MNPARLINLDGALVTVSQSGPVDDYNNPTDETVSTAVKCWYEQVQAGEDTVDTDQQSETHRLFFRAGTTVTALDRLTVNGLTFEVQGPPWTVVHPRTDQTTHVEARGRQVV